MPFNIMVSADACTVNSRCSFQTPIAYTSMGTAILISSAYHLMPLLFSVSTGFLENVFVKWLPDNRINSGGINRPA